LIEGEEECGSRGFESAIKAGKEKIGDVDWILLANSYWLDDRIPCLTYGLRGVIHATVQIESSHPDLHSGVDGSRQLDESLKDLVMLLAQITGKNGEVRIPGFYDPIPGLSDDERALYNDITTALIQRNPSLGNKANLAASLMRRWREASLTIHRFQTSGPENATIIPRLAKVALSLRLVPNQESAIVAKALTDFLHSEFEKMGSSNHLTVTIDHQAEPWLGDFRNEIFQMLEEAIMDAWAPELERLAQPSSAARRGSTVALKVSIPEPSKTNGTAERGSGYFTKPSPTMTSSVLANGSLGTPDLQPLTPLTEVTKKLEDLGQDEIASPSCHASPKSKGHSRTKSNPKTDVSSKAINGDNSKKPNGTTTTTTTTNCRRKPLYIREGGSIPAIRFLEKEFGAPAAHFPCGQASDSAHLDNERLRLVNLYRSKEIFKRVFRELPLR
jgi:di- and tripeptidase